jgi:hypothetical protein
MLAAPLVGDLEMQAQAGGDVLAVGSVGSAWTRRRFPCASSQARSTPISVREFTGKIHPLAVDVNRSGLDQDVSDLKAKVQTATGVTPDAQCLIIEGGDGKPLDDDTKKLRACVGLKSGALVHLTMQDEEKGRARREEHKVAREAKEAKWLAKVRVGSIVGVVDDDDQVGVVAQMPTTSTSFARCRWEDGTESSHRLERLRPPSVQEKAEAAPWVAAETWRRQRQKAKHMMKLTLGFAVCGPCRSSGNAGVLLRPGAARGRKGPRGGDLCCSVPPASVWFSVVVFKDNWGHRRLDDKLNENH